MTATAMSERELLQNVLDCARLYGWMCYHTFDSRRSEPGFPDIILTRRLRLLAIECKRQRGVVSAAQTAWLDALNESGADTYVVRPSDWLSGRIEEVLR